jgi:LysR family transcriptional activator of nhaA
LGPLDTSTIRNFLFLSTEKPHYHRMEWLNYHHLLYFWTVAREGGIGPAGKRLSLSPQTISGQVNALEEAMGVPLFERQGRRLVLTDTGRLVYGYADEIFTLGRELVDAVRGRPTGRPLRLVVGIAEVVPKLIAKRLLATALASEEDPPLQLVCREDAPDRLLVDLAAHRLDALILDRPVPPGSGIKAFNHALGDTATMFFATRAQAKALRAGFPRSLDGFPVLLPTEQAAVRRGLEDWFHALGIRPRIAAEFDDSALLKVFGQDGLGAFPGPEAIAAEIAAQHDVEPIGLVDTVRERFYAVTMQRRLEHPAIKALTVRARSELFAAQKR